MNAAEPKPPFFDPALESEIDRLSTQDHPDLVVHADRRLQQITEHYAKMPQPPAYQLRKVGARVVIGSGIVYAISRDPFVTTATGMTIASLNIMRRQHAETMRHMYNSRLERLILARIVLRARNPDRL